MKYIAYTFKRGRRELQSRPYDTRQEAANELFATRAKLKTVETAEAYFDGYNWCTSGRNIQPISRESV